MKTSSALRLAIASLSLGLPLSLVAAGCTQPVDSTTPDEAVGEAEQGIGIYDPPGGRNGKDPWCHWHPAVQRAYRWWGNHAATSLVPFNDVPLECRQEVVENLVQCALTPTQGAANPYGGGGIVGRWGLAPEWLHGPLSASSRRWVTACMAQRLNYYGEEVDILLEGNTPPIYTSASLDPIFSFDESNAWGDLFSSTLRDTYKIEVCYSPDLEDLCGGTFGMSPAEWLNSRICKGNPQFNDPAVGDYPCGLVVRGPCASTQVCPTQTPYPVCKRTSGMLDDHPIHVQLLPHRTCSL